MTEDLTIYTDDLERSEADPRRLVIRLARYGEVASTPQGRETFGPGAFSRVEPGTVVLESQRHDGAIVGVGEAIEERDDGAYGVFRVSDTSEGRDLLTLVSDKVLRAASVVFRPITTIRRSDGVIERRAVSLKRVAILPRGAYPSSEVIAMRNDMSEATQTPQEAPVAPATPEVDLGPILSRMDSHEAAIARVEASTAMRTDDKPLEYRSWSELFDAVQERPEVNDDLRRVFEDNTFDNNQGLLGSANIARIIEPVAAKRRTINAVGLAGLPATGMSLDYIKFDPTSSGYRALVQEQVAEKDEIGTGQHGWVPATEPIKTYAGGSDNSWQLLQRSAPSFRALLLRQYASEWAYKTNMELALALFAGGTPDTLALNDVDQEINLAILRAKLIDQSIGIEAEVDRPASVVLCATDVWSAIAKNPFLSDPEYGTVNQTGIMSAGSLRVDISGLAILHEPNLLDGEMLTTVGSGEAAAWHEDFKGIITAENIARLGTDIAIWGLGAAAVYRAAAIYATTVTLV